jgi:formylglycine-generating enzyme required for sulfatase activity
MQSFLMEHISNDLWDEALRLAVGYLAIKGEDKANRLVLQIAKAGTNDESKARALYVAGLALADVPQVRRMPETIHTLVPQIEKILSSNPPRVGIRARFSLGLALGSLGDPRLKPLEPDCVPVPGGVFRMGTSAEEEKTMEAQDVKVYDDEKPSHSVFVSEFSIGKFPITNLEYSAFYADQGYEQEEFWSKDGWAWRTGKYDSNVSKMEDKNQRESYERWLKQRTVELRDRPFYWDNPQWNAPNLPVVGVSWFEVEAFCTWLSRKTGKVYRLPTEAEWEKAARGADNTIWSWGNTWNGEFCNNADKETAEKLNRTSPVGMYPQGVSGYGALDMLGNVWEWCSDWFDDGLYQKRAEELVKDPMGVSSGIYRVLRGGSFDNNRGNARCAYRLGDYPVDFGNLIGFRVCVSPIIKSAL